LRQVGPDFAGRESYRDSLAAVHYHRGLLTAPSDWAGASKDLDAAARGWDRLHQDFPSVPRYAARAADAFLFLGRMHWTDDRQPEAEAVLRRADDLYGGLAEKWEKEPEYRNGRDSSRYYLALVLRKEAQFDEAAKLFEGLTVGAPRNAEYQTEFGEITLALASRSKLVSYALFSLPPVGLTVVPNPLGMFQAYIGQQSSAKAEATTARDRYRQSLDHLRLAEECGRTALSSDQLQALARNRFAAAQGLFGAALLIGDAESMAAAGETVAELTEAWPSLNAPNDAARNYRLAAMYSGFAVGISGAEGDATAHAKRMLQLLHKAVDKGFRNAAELRASMDVQGLLNNPHSYLSEQREALKKLLTDLENGPNRLP
jgi:tetratricopeptide (TPR) repeat protein